MRLRSVLVGAVLATAGLVVPVGPAAAKGISDGVIEGAGLDAPLEVDARALYEEMSLDLADFGFEFTAPAGAPAGSPVVELAAVAPASASRLGPELTVTWRVDHQDQTIVQELYPYAGGGPVVHTGAGQFMYDMEIRSGWFQADEELLTALQTLGLPEQHELAGGSVSEAKVAGAGRPSDAAPVDPSPDGGSGLLIPGGILAAVALTGICGLTVVRMRRARRRQLTPAT